jgi:hypothetical protein
MKSKCCGGELQIFKSKIRVIVSRLNLQQIFFIYCQIQQSNIANIVYYYFYIFILFVFSNTYNIYLYIYNTFYFILILTFAISTLALLPVAFCLHRNHYHRLPWVTLGYRDCVTQEATFACDYCNAAQAAQAAQAKAKGAAVFIITFALALAGGKARLDLLGR